MFFSLQLLSQFLDQIQSLDLQSVTPEHFQSRRHLRDLVATADLDLGLQIAAAMPRMRSDSFLSAQQDTPDEKANRSARLR